VAFVFVPHALKKLPQGTHNDPSAQDSFTSQTPNKPPPPGFCAVICIVRVAPLPLSPTFFFFAAPATSAWPLLFWHLNFDDSL